MKICIWILTIIVTTAINMALGEVAGFKMGGLLLYIVTGAIANVLCRKYDERNKPSDEDDSDENNKIPMKFKQHYWNISEDDRKNLFNKNVSNAWTAASKVAKTQYIINFENISLKHQIKYIDIYIMLNKSIKAGKDDSVIADELFKAFPDIIDDTSKALKAVLSVKEDLLKKETTGNAIKKSTNNGKETNTEENNPVNYENAAENLPITDEETKKSIIENDIETPITTNDATENTEDDISKTDELSQDNNNTNISSTAPKKPAKVHVTVKQSTNKPEFCRKCGSQLNDGDVFCRKCGTKV